jgi:hypothetical protein
VADYKTGSDFTSLAGVQDVAPDDTVTNVLDGKIYVYVGDANTALNLSSTDFSDEDLWEPADLAFHEGNTVQHGNVVYRYIGEDDEINLGTVNFSGRLAVPAKLEATRAER